MWISTRRMRQIQPGRLPAATPRRRQARQPRVEALEGRALMTYYTALDPTFGQRGQVYGPADNGTGTTLSAGSAVAIQADGKIVEVGTYAIPPQYNKGYPQLAVQRFNANGSVDTSFGTNGQMTIPLPSSSIGVAAGPRTILIGSNGSITFATTLATTGSTALSPATEGMVVQLTATGALDPSFATTGEYLITGSNATANAVATESDGNLLVLGSRLANAGGQLTLTSLTTAGALDTSFNTSGTLNISLPTAQQNSTATYSPGSLVVAPSGQIYVAGSSTGTQYGTTYSNGANLTQVNANGTLDTTYATGGTATLPTNYDNAPAILQNLALQTDGKVVVTGYSEDGFTYQGYVQRINTDGSTDTAFAANAPSVIGPVLNGLGVNSVIIGSDGSILLGGSSKYGSKYLTLLRLTSTGSLDPSFGNKGSTDLVLNGTVSANSSGPVFQTTMGGMAVTSAGQIIVGAGLELGPYLYFSTDEYENVLLRVLPVTTALLPGDYDGDGISDISVLLTSDSVIAYRSSATGTDTLTQFGMPGVGNSIPSPGDYDGISQTNLSVYLPTLGQAAYREDLFTQDIRTTLGVAGAGANAVIPAPGDYEGIGRDDQAVYVPATATFVIKLSSGTIESIPFGTPGVDGSIPAPGDYDGSGKTELAVYIPSLGIFAYRPANGGPDKSVIFGMPGDHMSIPAPGDYDGDGKTDFAVYMPTLGVFAYRSSLGGPDVLTAFGTPGFGNSIPAPGDYDGDGKFDVAVYLPNLGVFAYRSSSTGKDVLTAFGTPGTEASIPMTSIPYAQYTGSTGGTSGITPNSTTTGGSGGSGGSGSAAVYIPLLEDGTDQPTTKKKSTTAVS